MGCPTHRLLVEDEAKAWAVYTALNDSGSADQKELARLLRNAGIATDQLTEHIRTCPVCDPPLAKQ
jgi:hypothetical protein